MNALRTLLAAGCSLALVQDAGLMADLYLGPDDYDINFDRYVTALRIGLMFNFGGVARPHP